MRMLALLLSVRSLTLLLVRVVFPVNTAVLTLSGSRISSRRPVLLIPLRGLAAARVTLAMLRRRVQFALALPL